MWRRVAALAQLVCTLAANKAGGGGVGTAALRTNYTAGGIGGAGDSTDARRQLQNVDCVGEWTRCTEACVQTFAITAAQGNGGSACEAAHDSSRGCFGGECLYFELPEGLPSNDGIAYIGHTRANGDSPDAYGGTQRCSAAVVRGDFGGVGDGDDIYVINRECADGTGVTRANELLLHDPAGMGVHGGFKAVRSEGYGIVSDEDDSRDAVVADFDGDGDDDIFVVNYEAPNKMYLQNDAEKFDVSDPSLGNRFVAAAISDAPHLSRSSRSTAVATGDFNGDGIALDLFIANYEQRNEMYVSNGGPSYEYTEVTSGDAVACCVSNGVACPPPPPGARPAAACTRSRDVIVLDWLGTSRATSQGSVDDLFVLNGQELPAVENDLCEVFVNTDGSGNYAEFIPEQLTNHPLLSAAFGFSGAYSKSAARTATVAIADVRTDRLCLAAFGGRGRFQRRCKPQRHFFDS